MPPLAARAIVFIVKEGFPGMSESCSDGGKPSKEVVETQANIYSSPFFRCWPEKS
jgi:hypothetical protein